jgi:hypothetical protein
MKGGNRFEWTPGLLSSLYASSPDRLLRIINVRSMQRNDTFALKFLSKSLIKCPSTSPEEIARGLSEIVRSTGAIDAEGVAALLEPALRTPGKVEILRQFVASGLAPQLLQGFSFGQFGPEISQTATLYSIGGEDAPEVARALTELAKGPSAFSGVMMPLKQMQSGFQTWQKSNPEEAQRYLLGLTNPTLQQFLLEPPPLSGK